MLGLGFLGAAAVSHSAEVDNDKTAVTHYVANGGCLKEFREAMRKCDRYEPNSARRRVVDVEACVGATKALRECFGRNADYFEHQYIKRLDSGLDQDGVWQEDVGKYRWWSGMRRN
uniref:Uncharacterized protein n=1 Tax=Hordeum vulgare subsp. vulgare TaxID=112509 RepID=A0A8I7BK70_HORVV